MDVLSIIQGMSVSEITISLISLITTVIGLYYLGIKRAAGYVWFTISLSCQMYLFYISENIFLVIQMIILIILNVKNYRKWKLEEVDEV